MTILLCIKHTHTHTHIYIAYHHSAAEHRASSIILYLTLFMTFVLISVQIFLTLLASSSTFLRHVFLGLPLPRLPWWFYSRACLVMSPDGLRNVWSSLPHLRFLICKSILRCFVRFHSSSFFIWSGQKILSIFLRHLLIKTCSLVVIHFEFFQVPQPYSRTAFKFVLKRRSLVCVEYAVECQIFFSVLNVTWALRMRSMISASVPPVLSIMFHRYAYCVTLSMVSLYVQRVSLFFMAIRSSVDTYLNL